jgi:broad specificity phosphatase PhoE
MSKTNNQEQEIEEEEQEAVTSVTLLRHAQSTSNDRSNHCIDPALTRKGLNQALSLSGHYDLVLCSPLRRTMETLSCSSITYDHLVIEPILREKISLLSSLMLMEGRRSENSDLMTERLAKGRDSVKGRDSAIVRDSVDYYDRHEALRETKEEFEERMEQVRELITEYRKDYESILVVTHSKVIKYFTGSSSKNAHYSLLLL